LWEKVDSVGSLKRRKECNLERKERRGGRASSRGQMLKKTNGKVRCLGGEFAGWGKSRGPGWKGASQKQGRERYRQEILQKLELREAKEKAEGARNILLQRNGPKRRSEKGLSVNFREKSSTIT